MPGSIAGRGDASIQAFFPPTHLTTDTNAHSTIGDGFTDAEVRGALTPRPAEQWHPSVEYADCEISDLDVGPRAVTFMGRIANIFDVRNSPKSPRSARGCVKLSVKDGESAITVSLQHSHAVMLVPLTCTLFRCASGMPRSCLKCDWAHSSPCGQVTVRLDNKFRPLATELTILEVSNGVHGTLSSANAPLFTSLFPERDRNCHIMVHEHSDDALMYTTPLGFREGVPLNKLMTLQNFLDGGYDVVNAKILVFVKSVGAKKKVTRKDQSTTENVSLKIQDHTAEATLGLWGLAASSPFANANTQRAIDSEPDTTKQGWKVGETVLLIQAPSSKTGRSAYLTLAASTIIDVDPSIPDTDWLRKWSLRQRSREAINPAFPEGVFDLEALERARVRCLFSIAELDEFARVAPYDNFQGYLSILLTEIRLVHLWRRQMLLCGECCSIALYANATTMKCKGCDRDISLRLNPKLVGQVIDETGSIGPGKLLFSDAAWKDLWGRTSEELLQLDHDQLQDLAECLLYSRLTLVFGWTGDASKAGGRICVLGVRG